MYTVQACCYMFYLLDMCDRVGWLVVEEEIDGMFAGDVGCTNPCRHPHCFTRLYCHVITEWQCKHVATVHTPPDMIHSK